jgi:hypothetical protein
MATADTTTSQASTDPVSAWSTRKKKAAPEAAVRPVREEGARL